MVSFTQKSSTFVGISVDVFGVHYYVHFREHFCERVRGSNFAVRVLCAVLIDFLEVALVLKFPDGILPKQTSKKFASEPPKPLKKSHQMGAKY